MREISLPDGVVISSVTSFLSQEIIQLICIDSLYKYEFGIFH